MYFSLLDVKEVSHNVTKSELFYNIFLLFNKSSYFSSSADPIIARVSKLDVLQLMHQ